MNAATLTAALALVTSATVIIHDHAALNLGTGLTVMVVADTAGEAHAEGNIVRAALLNFGLSGSVKRVDGRTAWKVFQGREGNCKGYEVGTACGFEVAA